MKKTLELFNWWNEKKKEIEFSDTKKKINVRSGQFWRYFEGMNIGNEISKGGKFCRVCLILKTNTGNGLVQILPLTTKHHDWMEKYYVEIKNHTEFEGLKQTRGVINQIQFIDKKRLSDKVCEKQCKEGVILYTLKKYINFLRT